MDRHGYPLGCIGLWNRDFNRRGKRAWLETLYYDNEWKLVLVLFGEISLLTLATWGLSNLFLYVEWKIQVSQSKRQQTKTKIEREVISGKCYKSLIDYLAAWFTVLSFIFLCQDEPNEFVYVLVTARQTAAEGQRAVRDFGSLFGGIICAYDVVLMIIGDGITWWKNRDGTCFEKK